MKHRTRSTCRPGIDRPKRWITFARSTDAAIRLFKFLGRSRGRTRRCRDGIGCQARRRGRRVSRARGEKVGVLQVHLYRPFPVEALSEALPPLVHRRRRARSNQRAWILGEPLYLDVVTALCRLQERQAQRRCRASSAAAMALSSKEFDPAMAWRYSRSSNARDPKSISRSESTTTFR